MWHMRIVLQQVCFVWRHGRIFDVLLTLQSKSTDELNLIRDVAIGNIIVIFQSLRPLPNQMFLHCDSSKFRYVVDSESIAVFMIEHLEYVVVQIENRTI